MSIAVPVVGQVISVSTFGQPVVDAVNTLNTNVAALQVNDLADTAAWTLFTSTWTSNGTAVSLGNGTIVAYYRKVGKTVDVVITLTMGSTTTFGTGFYLFSLPVLPVRLGNLGANKNLDAGVIDRSGVSYLFDLVTTGHIVAATNAGSVGQTSPHTWGNADVLSVQMRYESAT